MFVPRDFAALAPRSAVDKALSRLAADGTGRVRRVGRGVYDRPRVSRRLGIVAPPDADAAAAAVGRRTGSRVLPSGATAANRLGLSTQVPARHAYLTDGPTRAVRLGPIELRFRHAPPWLTRAAGADPRDPVPLALAAMRHLGRRGVDGRAAATLAASLSPRDRRRLADAASVGPAWLASAARRVAGAVPGGVVLGDTVPADGEARGRVRPTAAA